MSGSRRALEQIPELIQLFDSVSLPIIEKEVRIRLMDRDRDPLFDQGGMKLKKNGRNGSPAYAPMRTVNRWSRKNRTTP